MISYRRLVCGPNAIEIEIRPIWKLLFKEVSCIHVLYVLLSLEGKAQSCHLGMQQL